MQVDQESSSYIHTVIIEVKGLQPQNGMTLQWSQIPSFCFSHWTPKNPWSSSFRVLSLWRIVSSNSEILGVKKMLVWRASINFSNLLVLVVSVYIYPGKLCDASFSGFHNIKTQPACYPTDHRLDWARYSCKKDQYGIYNFSLLRGTYFEIISFSRLLGVGCYFTINFEAVQGTTTVHDNRINHGGIYRACGVVIMDNEMTLFTVLASILSVGWVWS